MDWASSTSVSLTHWASCKTLPPATPLLPPYCAALHTWAQTAHGCTPQGSQTGKRTRAQTQRPVLVIHRYPHAVLPSAMHAPPSAAAASTHGDDQALGGAGLPAAAAGAHAWRSTLSPAAREGLAGALGGGLGVVAGQPLDTVRIRQQQQPAPHGHHHQRQQHRPQQHVYASSYRPHGTVTARVSGPHPVAVAWGLAGSTAASAAAAVPCRGVAAAAACSPNAFQALRHMVAAEGALAPFRGIVYPLCASALSVRPFTHATLLVFPFAFFLRVVLTLVCVYRLLFGRLVQT